ncbi:MAG: histidine phosphatase family protein [Nitrospirae bacterium]|nr:histidine phosphatase family protein [Nitrospirota bacterium]
MGEQNRELWLIRHGETEWSAAGRHTGRTDIPLTESGRCQAEALAERLAGSPFALVLSSPLVRAFETCRLAGFGDVALVTDDLEEWNYGEYEGRMTADIRRQVPGWTIWTKDPPGGETADEVAARARNVITRAEASEGTVALFGHAHMLRVLAACWLALRPDAGRFFALGTASISVLGYERETRAIMTWNQDWRLFRRDAICSSP